MKKMWFLILSCKEAFVHFAFESPYSIFIITFRPYPFIPFPFPSISYKKKQLCTTRLVKSLSFTCITNIYQIEKTNSASFLKRFEITPKAFKTYRKIKNFSFSRRFGISIFFGKKVRYLKNKTHTKEKSKFKYHASKTLLDCNWIDLFSKRTTTCTINLICHLFLFSLFLCFLSFILFTHDNLIILRIFLLCILAIKPIYLYTN